MCRVDGESAAGVSGFLEPHADDLVFDYLIQGLTFPATRYDEVGSHDGLFYGPLDFLLVPFLRKMSFPGYCRVGPWLAKT